MEHENAKINWKLLIRSSEEMKKLIQTISLAGFVILTVGCSTPYMVDRGRDVADVFTVTVGYGVGVKARVGPLGTGLFINSDIVGLRAGTFFRIEDDSPIKPTDFTSIIPRFYMFPIFVEEDFNLNGVPKLRHKDFDAVGVLFPFYTWVSDPCDSSTRWVYNTQLEVAIGIGGTIRLGFNPGELLDCILGWTTIDMLGDDLESRKKKSNNGLEPTSTP